MCERITVTQRELYLMLVSSVRYALGRASYIVGDTCDAVRRYATRLTTPMVETLLRDIERELRRAEGDANHVGHEMDHREWQRLADALRLLLDGRASTEGP